MFPHITHLKIGFWGSEELGTSCNHKTLTICMWNLSSLMFLPLSLSRVLWTWSAFVWLCPVPSLCLLSGLSDRRSILVGGVESDESRILSWRWSFDEWLFDWYLTDCKIQCMREGLQRPLSLNFYSCREKQAQINLILLKITKCNFLSYCTTSDLK